MWYNPSLLQMKMIMKPKVIMHQIFTYYLYLDQNFYIKIK
jgi:hypothetical protein